MARTLTLHKSAHCFFPGKNRIRKIREKSGYEISNILGEILRKDTINCCFMVKCGFLFVIHTNFDIFDTPIFDFISTNLYKNQLDIHFVVTWDIFWFIITVLYDNGFLLVQGLYVVFRPIVRGQLENYIIYHSNTTSAGARCRC